MAWMGTTLPLTKSAYQYVHYKVLLLLLAYVLKNAHSFPNITLKSVTLHTLRKERAVYT